MLNGVDLRPEVEAARAAYDAQQWHTFGESVRVLPSVLGLSPRIFRGFPVVAQVFVEFCRSHPRPS